MLVARIRNQSAILIERFVQVHGRNKCEGGGECEWIWYKAGKIVCNATASKQSQEHSQYSRGNVSLSVV